MQSQSLQWYKTAIQPSETEMQVHFTDGFGNHQTLTKHHNQAIKCSCGMPNPCPHIRLLPFITTDVFQLESSPQDLALDKSIEQKDIRRADRILKLQRAMDELQLWMEEILSRGLAAQIQENQDFIEHLATRMSDASLTSLTRRLHDLQKETLFSLRSNQDLPLAWTDLAILLQAGKHQQKLPVQLWAELSQTLGINYRKEDVRTLGKRIQDIFTVIGIEKITIEPRLNQRSTWLYAHQASSWHCIIEFEFEGQTYLSAELPIAYQFEATAFAYPSVFSRRIWFDDIPEKPTNRQVTLTAYPSLSAAQASYAKELTQIPWLTEVPVLLNQARITFYANSWYVLDLSEAALPISPQSHLVAEKLFAQSAGSPIQIFGLIHSNSMRIVSSPVI